MNINENINFSLVPAKINTTVTNQPENNITENKTLSDKSIQQFSQAVNSYGIASINIDRSSNEYKIPDAEYTNFDEFCNTISPGRGYYIIPEFNPETAQCILKKAPKDVINEDQFYNKANAVINQNINSGTYKQLSDYISAKYPNQITDIKLFLTAKEEFEKERGLLGEAYQQLTNDEDGLGKILIRRIQISENQFKEVPIKISEKHISVFGEGSIEKVYAFYEKSLNIKLTDTQKTQIKKLYDSINSDVRDKLKNYGQIKTLANSFNNIYDLINPAIHSTDAPHKKGDKWIIETKNDKGEKTEQVYTQEEWDKLNHLSEIYSFVPGVDECPHAIARLTDTSRVDDCDKFLETLDKALQNPKENDTHFAFIFKNGQSNKGNVAVILKDYPNSIVYINIDSKKIVSIVPNNEGLDILNDKTTVHEINLV